MNASEVEFGSKYTLKPSRMLDRAKPITVTVVERSQRLDFFKVRDEDGRLLTESVHASELAPVK